MTKPESDFIWYELMTTDPDAAADFYGAVVGWKITGPVGPDGRDYRMIARDDGGNAGGVLGLTKEMCEAGARPIWMPYLYAADVDATLSAIEAEGATVQMPPADLPVGRIAMVTDPQGVPIYVMHPIPPEGNPDAVSDVFSREAVQHARWNELASPDLEASKRFYARYFGFEFNEAMSMGEMGDYCFIDRGDKRLGAIMQRQNENQPAAWLIYFGVPSVTKAKAAIEQNGGSVLMGPQEVPGGEWVIAATDPQGAGFGLVSSGE